MFRSFLEVIYLLTLLFLFYYYYKLFLNVVKLRRKTKTTLGFKYRKLSHTELLNRNYYRGRFASFKKNQIIDNWEEIPL